MAEAVHGCNISGTHCGAAEGSGLLI